MSRTIGQYLTGLRTSSAAGIHVRSGTRSEDERDAIAEQLADMEGDMTELRLIQGGDDGDLTDDEEVLAIGYEDDPSDEEILLIDKEEPRVDEEFASLMREYGLKPNGDDAEDYVPEPRAPYGLDDNRYFDLDPDEYRDED